MELLKALSIIMSMLKTWIFFTTNAYPPLGCVSVSDEATKFQRSNNQDLVV